MTQVLPFITLPRVDITNQSWHNQSSSVSLELGTINQLLACNTSPTVD